MHNGIKVGLF